MSSQDVDNILKLINYINSNKSQNDKVFLDFLKNSFKNCKIIFSFRDCTCYNQLDIKKVLACDLYKRIFDNQIDELWVGDQQETLDYICDFLSQEICKNE